MADAPCVKYKNDCFDYAIEALEGAIEISEVAPPASPLVLDKIFV